MCLFCTVLFAHDENGEPLPEAVAFCVEEALNGTDDLPPLPNQQPLIYESPQLPLDFFFDSFYAEIQKYDFQHTVVPYSVLVEQPGILFSFTQQATHKDVSIINENSPDRNITIGRIPQGTNKNYVTLNQETRYVPQIKKLYTMFLKKESDKLLLSKEERQKALGDLLRCNEVYQLYVKAGQMTTMYYEINEILFKNKVPVFTDLVRKVIESKISRGAHDSIHQLVQAYQNQLDTFTLMTAYVENEQKIKPSQYTSYKQIFACTPPRLEGSTGSLLRAEAAAFTPRGHQRWKDASIITI